jgi:hypothetical protein
LTIRHPVIAVSGLNFEAHIASGPGVIALCSSDRHQLDRAISAEILRGCRGIISFGIAGGLCPNLAPGACVVARSIVTPTKRFATDGAWSRHLTKHFRPSWTKTHHLSYGRKGSFKPRAQGVDMLAVCA